MVSRQQDERALIAGTLKDIEGAIERLEADRQEIEYELGEKRRRLQQWRARLSELDRKSGTEKATRRRKGENREVIAQRLTAERGRGLSIAKIADSTGLPWSSVRATLKRNTETFVEREGVWYLREPELANGNGHATTQTQE